MSSWVAPDSFCKKVAATSTSFPCVSRVALHVLMSTDGQRSRSFRIDANVTRVSALAAAGSACGDAAGKGWPGRQRPGEAKGDPAVKEKDDSRRPIPGVGGNSSVASLSPMRWPLRQLERPLLEQKAPKGIRGHPPSPESGELLFSSFKLCNEKRVTASPTVPHPHAQCVMVGSCGARVWMY